MIVNQRQFKVAFDVQRVGFLVQRLPRHYTQSHEYNTFFLRWSSGVTRDSGAPRQIFKWGPPFFVIIFMIHTIPHDIRVEFKFKLKFIGVCCCNAATKHSMVWIVMPTLYCNYFFCLELGGPLHSGAPGLCLPCLPNCYATALESP